MGLNVFLQDENGHTIDRVIDNNYVFMSLINSIPETEGHCARFIDLYGNTVFNRLQIGHFIKEVEEHSALLKKPADRELILRIIQLAARCAKEPHLYIKIVGD